MRWISGEEILTWPGHWQQAVHRWHSWKMGMAAAIRGARDIRSEVRRVGKAGEGRCVGKGDGRD